MMVVMRACCCSKDDGVMTTTTTVILYTLLPLFLVTLACLPLTTRAAASSLPFREGYSLGSLIPQSVVDEMLAESVTRRDLRTIDAATAEATSLLRDLRSDSIAPDDDSTPMTADESAVLSEDLLRLRKQVTATRSRLIRKKVATLERLASQLDESVSKMDVDSTSVPVSSSSPVRWSASRVMSSLRAVDTLRVDATFIEAVDVNQTVDVSRHAKHVLGNVTDSLAQTTMPRSMMQDIVDQVAGKVKHVSDGNRLHSTLVLSAFATHRLARHFDPLVFDHQQLRLLWNKALNASAVTRFTIPHPYHQSTQFNELVTRLQSDSDFAASAAAVTPLHLVTEVHMGSSLVGLVRFTKKEQTDSHADVVRSNLREQLDPDNISTAGSANESSFLAQRDQAAKRIASLASVAALDVAFDMACIGFVPKLRSDRVSSAVKSFMHLDPSLIDFPASNTLMSHHGATSAVISATLSSLAHLEKESGVLTANSFMDAFDDFAMAARSSAEHMGAPVGFRTRAITVFDVIDELRR